jgi:integrase
VEVELKSLVRYAQRTRHRGSLTVRLVTQWSQQAEGHPQYQTYRLNLARRLAIFCAADDPRVEIPPVPGNPTYQRRTPYIYSEDDIVCLKRASVQLGQVHPLRTATFRTLVGLLYCTGLRIGEALGLTDQDVDGSEGVLTIRHAKNNRPRTIPIDTSTLRALETYRAVRRRSVGASRTGSLFVDFRGRPLGYFGISGDFRRLCQQLGWIRPPVPRLHDFRHTFTVNTLLAWYRNGEPVGPKLWSLSTYLGHRHLNDTYWYLTAVPQLLELGLQRFAKAQAWASQEGCHE